MCMNAREQEPRPWYEKEWKISDLNTPTTGTKPKSHTTLEILSKLWSCKVPRLRPSKDLLVEHDKNQVQLANGVMHTHYYKFSNQKERQKHREISKLSLKKTPIFSILIISISSLFPTTKSILRWSTYIRLHKPEASGSMCIPIIGRS